MRLASMSKPTTRALLPELDCQGQAHISEADHGNPAIQNATHNCSPGP